MATKKIIVGSALVGTTIVSILAYLMTIQGVTITGSGDIKCAGTLADPCVSYFNITSVNHTLKFFNMTKGQKLDFSPEIKNYTIYKLTSGKWKETPFPINMTKGTLYQFKIVGYKMNPMDNVKWGVIIGDGILDPWWNSSFSRKTPITVNTTSSVTNYQLYLNVTYDSDMQSDFDDLRFMNGSENVELSYWIERNVSSQYAIVWIKGNWSNSNGTQAYMYYGCPTCISTTNGTNVFVDFEQFAGASDFTSNWQLLNTGSWSYVFTSEGVNITYNVGASWVKILNRIPSIATANTTLLYGLKSYNATYIALSWTSYGYEYRNPIWGIEATIGSSTVSGGFSENNIYYTVRGVRNSSTNCYIIPLPNTSIQVSTTNLPTTPANAGVWNYGTTSTYLLRFYAVANYSYPEPTYSIGGEEIETVTPSFTINNTESDKIMEFGEYAELKVVLSSGVSNISIGKNILNSSSSATNLVYNFLVKPYWTIFNNTLNNQNATKIGTNYIISFANQSRNNSYISCKANFTGFIDAGSYAKNILIDTGNDGFIDNYLMGELQENQKLYVDSLSTGDKSINVTMTSAGSTTRYFNLSSFPTTNVTFNISGYTEPAYLGWDDKADDWNYTCNNYDYCTQASYGTDGDWTTAAFVRSWTTAMSMTFVEKYTLPVDSTKILNISLSNKFGMTSTAYANTYQHTVYIFNWNTGVWDLKITNSSTAASTSFTNTTNVSFAAPNYVSNGQQVLVKTSFTAGAEINWYGYYYGGSINFNVSGVSVDNVTIDAGADGGVDWAFLANMNGSTPQTITNFSEPFNNYISTKCNTTKSCKVPITIITGSGGKLNISAIKINSTITGVNLNVTAMNRQLSLTTSNITFNITNNTKGIVNMLNLVCPYYGNGNVTLTGCNSTICINRNITVYYSNFSKTLPYTFTNSLLWYPTSNSSQNVTPYGQSATVPSYNITTKAWEKNMTLALRFNEPLSGNCINFTWATNSTKNISATVNATTSAISTYQVIRSNLNATNQSIGLWFWIDLYNCNSSQIRYYTPNITVKTCCSGCVSCY